MDVFNTTWLIDKLAKASMTPKGRLLSLFDILDDWLNALNIQQNASIDCSNINTTHPSLLLDFCTAQAQLLGAKNAPILAQHIVLIARTAVQQTIQQKPFNTQSVSNLMHAKKAAEALILAQTQKNYFNTNPNRVTLSIAASVLLMLVASALWFAPMTQAFTSPTDVTQNSPPTTATTFTEVENISASDASKIYAKYEQMRQGTCQFPEVLLIPDKHKEIYLENVVGGKLPSDLANLSIANYYLEKVRCNFTPMLMASSK